MTKKISLDDNFSYIELTTVKICDRWYYHFSARLLRVQLMRKDTAGSTSEQRAFKRGHNVLFEELDEYILYHSDLRLFNLFFNAGDDNLLTIIFI